MKFFESSGWAFPSTVFTVLFLEFWVFTFFCFLQISAKWFIYRQLLQTDGWVNKSHHNLSNIEVVYCSVSGNYSRRTNLTPLLSIWHQLEPLPAVPIYIALSIFPSVEGDWVLSCPRKRLSRAVNACLLAAPCHTLFGLGRQLQSALTCFFQKYDSRSEIQSYFTFAYLWWTYETQELVSNWSRCDQTCLIARQETKLMKMSNSYQGMNEHKMIIKGKWNWTKLNASYEILLHQINKWNMISMGITDSFMKAFNALCH